MFGDENLHTHTHTHTHMYTHTHTLTHTHSHTHTDTHTLTHTRAHSQKLTIVCALIKYPAPVMVQKQPGIDDRKDKDSTFCC